MGEGPSLDEIMRIRESMKVKFTPRFQKWWDEQIERKKQELGSAAPSRKGSLAVGAEPARKSSLAEEITRISSNRKQVSAC